MVETLVDIGRLEAGQMPVERQPVGLRALFEEAANQVASQAQAKGVQVDVEVLPDLVAWVDPGLIERVLVSTCWATRSSSRRRATGWRCRGRKTATEFCCGCETAGLAFPERTRSHLQSLHPGRAEAAVGQWPGAGVLQAGRGGARWVHLGGK
jgi:hypothetical protein